MRSYWTDPSYTIKDYLAKRKYWEQRYRSQQWSELYGSLKTPAELKAKQVYLKKGLAGLERYGPKTKKITSMIKTLRGQAWGSPKSPKDLRLKQKFIELGPRKFARFQEKEYREARREAKKRYRAAMKEDIESGWGEFKKARKQVRGEIELARARVYKALPKFRLKARQKIRGQRGYVPLSKRGIIRKEQARRERIRTKVLAPVRKAEQELSKAEQDIRRQAKQFGAQLD